MVCLIRQFTPISALDWEVGVFLKCTGCEKKNDLLLIDTFERLFNQIELGHLETGGCFLFA